MDGASHKMLADIPSHAHYVADAALNPSMRTEQIVVPSRHAATGIFQGTRGMYCTLPGELTLPLSPHSPFPRVILAEMDRLPAGSPATESNSGAAFDPLSYRGAHSDTTAVTSRPNAHADDRVRLRATCYFGDCPPGAGGFTARNSASLPCLAERP